MAGLQGGKGGWSRGFGEEADVQALGLNIAPLQGEVEQAGISGGDGADGDFLQPEAGSWEPGPPEVAGYEAQEHQQPRHG